MIYRCPCHKCIMFHDEEGVGWEDTCNGYHIIYCLDGKVRCICSDEGGCTEGEELGFVRKEYVQ